MAVVPSLQDPATQPISDERAKDVLTFRTGARRRYVLTVIVGLAGLAAAVAGVAPLLVFGACAAVNALVSYLARGVLGYAWWMCYTVVALDVSLVSVVVGIMGRDSLAVLYLAVIVPYSFDRGRALGYFTAVASALAFLLARLPMVEQSTEYPWVLATAAAILLVSSPGRSDRVTPDQPDPGDSRGDR